MAIILFIFHELSIGEVHCCYVVQSGILTQRTCARVKAIKSSVIIVGTKIIRFRVLSICTCCRHNQSVEKLVYICMHFNLLEKAY